MRLVFLYGGPASGKLTVARELAALTGFALFHNHLVVDAVAAVFPFGSAPFIRLRETLWLTMFREAADAKRSTIFTFAPEPTVDAGFSDRVKRAVEAAGGAVSFVRLAVPADEQERRIGNPDRRQFGKLSSLELLRQLREQLVRCEAGMPEAALTIDTARVPAPAAARLIVETLGLPVAGGDVTDG